MQPLGVSVMGPLSTYYSKEIEVWLRTNPGMVVLLDHVAGLFVKAYLKATIPSNAISKFSKTGIFPTDHGVFTEDMFEAATPTDNTESYQNHQIAEVDLSPSLIPTTASGSSANLPAT